MHYYYTSAEQEVQWAIERQHEEQEVDRAIERQ
jgi:hypothetical protein